jgi:lysophospholipase L1-like esterase
LLTLNKRCRWFIQHVLPGLKDDMQSGRASPSLVTLWLGANDAALADGYAAIQHVPLAAYRENLRAILTSLQAAAPADCKFLFITPPHVDDATRAARVTSGSLDRSNEAAGTYARACVEEAAAAGVAALDLHSFFNAMGEQERAAYLSDGLHFGAEGNRLVDELLRAKIADAFPALAARLKEWQEPNWQDLA